MVLRPKSQSSSEESFREGSLAAFDQDGTLQLAVVEGFTQKKAKLLTMREREIELQIQRLSFVPGEVPAGASVPDWLLKMHEKCEAKAANVPVEELWEFVSEEEREFSCGELCEIYYGENTTEDHLTLRLALNADRIFFKRKKDIYTPRPAETVEELKKAEAARKEKEELLKRALDDFERRASEPEAPLQEGTEETIETLERIAAGAAHVNNAEQKEIRNLLKAAEKRLGVRLGTNREERAYQLLSTINHFHANTNLSFIRHGLVDSFSKVVLEQAEQLDPESDEAIEREDLTSLWTVTIDDAATMDMDDALSIQRTSEGFQVGVHITDVASAVPIGSPLDHEARQRATSLYFPERTVHMFPPVLSEQRLSLVARKSRKCVSFLLEFDRQGELISSRPCLSLICVDEKLSYDEVDTILQDTGGNTALGVEHENDIHKLYELSMASEAGRLAEGALKLPRKDVQIVLSKPGDLRNSEFSLEDYDESGPARSMIGELMILANGEAARLAQEKEIPFVYRSQEPSDPQTLSQAEQMPAGPAQDYALRFALKRSEVSPEPRPHATLGIQSYGQITSPVRRYTDLVNQRQLRSLVLNEPPPYDAAALREIISECSEAQQRGRLLGRETKRFWLLKYLEQQYRDRKALEAVVIRKDPKYYLIEVSEIFMLAQLKTDQPLQPGDTLLVQVQSIDPRRDYLKLGLKQKIEGA